jgi:hypothetical protein
LPSAGSSSESWQGKSGPRCSPEAFHNPCLNGDIG